MAQHQQPGSHNVAFKAFSPLTDVYLTPEGIVEPVPHFQSRSKMRVKI